MGWDAVAAAVQRRLATLIERERLDDFMSVLALPEGVTIYEWGR